MSKTKTFLGRVSVMPRPEVLDPQGKAIAQALGRLDFAGVGEVRAGKRFEIRLEAADEAAATAALEAMCTKLLANEVMEDWYLESVEEASS